MEASMDEFCITKPCYLMSEFLRERYHQSTALLDCEAGDVAWPSSQDQLVLS